MTTFHAMHRIAVYSRIFALLGVVTCTAGTAYAVEDSRNPEVTNSVVDFGRTSVHGKEFMVVSANPHASEAGARILREGGNALDAAFAAQMVLNVVEPQSSGIGGGAFLMYYDAAQEKLFVYDGRETAPAAATPELFLDENGQSLSFMEAVQGGKSVGIPGLLKLVELTHEKHGRAEWPALFADAIRLSRDGFAMSPRLKTLVETATHMHAFPDTLAPYVNKDGSIKAVGDVITNPPLANVFTTIANEGIGPFYTGNIAQDIVKAVQKSAIHPGLLSLKDMKSYEVVEREALCVAYRVYSVCSMPPPSSGGVTVMQTLGILERLPVDIRHFAPLSADAVHYIAEASKLAYADRNRYLADPAYADVPAKKLLDKEYLNRRASLVSSRNVRQTAEPGQPDADIAAYAVAATREHPSTTHISVVDKEGNAVSLTSSVEYMFGSGLSVHGFVLNNQLTDFNFEPYLEDGKIPHPNRVEAGKRPRSSMSPTIVFNQQHTPVLVVGSPGGSRIITYVLQTLIGVLDWEMDIQDAINMPHYLNMNGPTELESNRNQQPLKAALEARGHSVIFNDAPSGIHGISIDAGGLTGGADPRREGVAIGQ